VPSDQTIIIAGTLSKMFKWLWNYELMLGKFKLNGVAFFALTHLAVGVGCALVF
jgi:hypothetical protein